MNGILLIPVYYLQIIPTLPLAFLQFLIYGRQIRKTSIANNPVFILGHYRSGTSLLQKLMVSDKRFGFLTYYDALFPNTNLLFGKRMQAGFQHLINFFEIQNPFFHDTLLQLSEPDEEDDYLMNKVSAYSAYWGMIFPQRWREWLNIRPQFSDQKYLEGWKKEYLNTLRYISFKNSGKQLLLKSPPNTERIRVLLEMFPQAKFIFIRRNPYNLYFSTLNMWKRAILKYYSVQRVSDQELEDLVINHFIHKMEQYETDKPLIPKGNIIEISYEELITNSFITIKSIYTELSLPGFELTAIDLLLKIESEKEYQCFQHRISTEDLNHIEEYWGKYIHQWNYEPPDIKQ